MDPSSSAVVYWNDRTTDNHVHNPCLPGAYRASHQLDGDGLVHGMCRLYRQSQNDSTVRQRRHAISTGMGTIRNSSANSVNQTSDVCKV